MESLLRLCSFLRGVCVPLFKWDVKLGQSDGMDTTDTFLFVTLSESSCFLLFWWWIVIMSLAVFKHRHSWFTCLSSDTAMSTQGSRLKWHVFVQRIHVLNLGLCIKYSKIQITTNLLRVWSFSKPMLQHSATSLYLTGLSNTAIQVFAQWWLFQYFSIPSPLQYSCVGGTDESPDGVYVTIESFIQRPPSFGEDVCRSPHTNTITAVASNLHWTSLKHCNFYWIAYLWKCPWKWPCPSTAIGPPRGPALYLGHISLCNFLLLC